jgi:hypothetical protein
MPSEATWNSGEEDLEKKRTSHTLRQVSEEKDMR